MGYDATARYILGIEVRRDQFFTTTVESLDYLKTVHQCSNGHVFSEPPPKYCPECGRIVMPKRTTLAPTPEVGKWLNDGTKDPDYIWETLNNRDGVGVHNVECKTTNEETDPSILAFGKLLGYSGSNGQGGGQTGLTLSELQDIADEIIAEAAKLGITGDVKLYIQLYESI